MIARCRCCAMARPREDRGEEDGAQTSTLLLFEKMAARRSRSACAIWRSRRVLMIIASVRCWWKAGVVVVARAWCGGRRGGGGRGSRRDARERMPYDDVTVARSWRSVAQKSGVCGRVVTFAFMQRIESGWGTSVSARCYVRHTSRFFFFSFFKVQRAAVGTLTHNTHTLTRYITYAMTWLYIMKIQLIITLLLALYYATLYSQRLYYACYTYIHIVIITLLRQNTGSRCYCRCCYWPLH